MRKIFIRIYKKIVYLLLKPILKREYKAQKEFINERPLEYSFALRHISKIYPKKILDIGPGKSSLPHLLYNCGFNVTSIDEMCGYWNKDLENRHFLIIKDSIVNPKIRQGFDLITCISTLEHIPDHESAVRNMFSLLKDGGYLILTFPFNEQVYFYNIYDTDDAGYGKSHKYICQVFSRNELEEWLKENNGEIIDQEYYNVFTGKYWTYGKRLEIPQTVSKNETYQLTALLLRKKSDGKKPAL
ncbi:MAG: class I SAM-dependent methyltransferase [Actinobacteria bacterium]|nr:class I SAM-dependent methyltransferase [Actinomycetota bacterium]